MVATKPGPSLDGGRQGARCICHAPLGRLRGLWSAAESTAQRDGRTVATDVSRISFSLTAKRTSHQKNLWRQRGSKRSVVMFGSWNVVFAPRVAKRDSPSPTGEHLAETLARVTHTRVTWITL